MNLKCEYRFDTAGEFTQALYDIKELQRKINDLDEDIENLNYLLFEKIKSPLDYDEYVHNGRVLRLIKEGGHGSQEAIENMRLTLSMELEMLENNKMSILHKIDNTMSTLNKIPQPLREILRDRYIEHKSWMEVCRIHEELYLNESGMYKYVHRELGKIFK